MAERPTVAMFVYGTLRPGHGNYRWAARGVDESRTVRDVRIGGDLYFVHGSGGYPVAKLDGEGEIVGDVVFFYEDSPEYHDVYRMEDGAGYDLIQVVPEDWDSDVPVYAWHYRGEPRGKQIRSGDWAAEAYAR